MNSGGALNRRARRRRNSPARIAPPVALVCRLLAPEPDLCCRGTYLGRLEQIGGALRRVQTLIGRGLRVTERARYVLQCRLDCLPVSAAPSRFGTG